MNASLAARLAAIFGGCAAAVFLVIGLWLHDSLRATLERQAHEDLALRAALMAGSIGKALNAEHWATWIVPKLEAVESTLPGTHVRVDSDDARLRFGTAHAAWADPTPFGHELSIPAQGERAALRLRFVREADTVLHTLDSFRATLVAAALGGISLVVALGYWIAGVGLRPLARLSQQAQSLRAGEPGQRLGFVPMPRELQRLTASFNGALDRLERARTQLEAFNANVAHELRTPLNNLIGQTQVAMVRQRSAAELEEVLGSNLEEIERMRGIVNDMLFLARADQGAKASTLGDAALAQEVARVIDFLGPLAAERQLRVELLGDLRVGVEPSLFRRAVSNLVHNAIQHAMPDGTIVVRIESHEGQPGVSVSNRGPEIESAHLAHLFERFYRADGARRSSDTNHGLGLSIVQAVAAMHGGRVFARSVAGWNTFGFTVSAVD